MALAPRPIRNGQFVSAIRSRPWRKVQWSSPLSPAECREQLLDVGTPHTSNRHSVKMHVVKWGAVFRIAAAYDRTGWLGGAYLDVYVVNAGNHTQLIGRFFPAPGGLIAASMLVLVFSLGAASLIHVGPSAFARVAGNAGPKTVAGIGMLLAVVALVVLGFYRLIGFQRQCLEIVGHVERTCSAHRI